MYKNSTAARLYATSTNQCWQWNTYFLVFSWLVYATVEKITRQHTHLHKIRWCWQCTRTHQYCFYTYF